MSERKATGSRMAYLGSNTLSSSSASEGSPYMIPTISAFNGRGRPDTLKDFYTEVSSNRAMDSRSRNVQEGSQYKDRQLRSGNPPSRHNPEMKQIQTQPDIIDRVELPQPRLTSKRRVPTASYDTSKTSIKHPSTLETDKIMVQLMNIKDRMAINDNFRMHQMNQYPSQGAIQQKSSLLEEKMLDFLMKQQPQPPAHPIIIQSPQLPMPNYYPPPPQYPPPQPQSTPLEPKKKNTKLIRRRLKKILWAVSFPFLLKAYSQKLRMVRKEYLVNNMGSLLEESVDLIKEWFLQSSSKAMAMLTQKIDISLHFDSETDESLQNQKLKCISALLEMILNNLLAGCKSERVREFLPFVSVTCDDRSFIPQGFATNKELQYISFSDQHEYQYLYPDLQQVQIMVFVFIKVIVFNILFQPWRFDKTLKKEPVQGNLALIGLILYYNCVEVIDERLKLPRPKTYQRGNMNDTHVPSPLLFDKSLPYDPSQPQYIHCLPPPSSILKIKTYKRGQHWRLWKENISQMTLKIHKEMVKMRPVVDKTIKQLELKYQRNAQEDD